MQRTRSADNTNFVGIIRHHIYSILEYLHPLFSLKGSHIYHMYVHHTVSRQTTATFILKLRQYNLLHISHLQLKRGLFIFNVQHVNTKTVLMLKVRYNQHKGTNHINSRHWQLQYIKFYVNLRGTKYILGSITKSGPLSIIICIIT